MQAQLDKLGLTAEFMPAVNGKKMSLEQLREITHDFDNSGLTAGEIGCSLSHISIYKKMVAENIQNALILEDDSIISSDLPDVLSSLESKNCYDKPHTYLLTSPQCYDKSSPIQIHGEYQSFKFIDAWNAHGYVINIAAATKMANSLNPVFLEADQWKHFSRAGYMNISCVAPILISNRDFSRENSNLEYDRALMADKRRKYYKNTVKNNIPLYLRIKHIFWRLFKRPFIKKVKIGY